MLKTHNKPQTLKTIGYLPLNSTLAVQEYIWNLQNLKNFP
jgi:hypothetical protein